MFIRLTHRQPERNQNLQEGLTEAHLESRLPAISTDCSVRSKMNEYMDRKCESSADLSYQGVISQIDHKGINIYLLRIKKEESNM